MLIYLCEIQSVYLEITENKIIHSTFFVVLPCEQASHCGLPIVEGA